MAIIALNKATVKLITSTQIITSVSSVVKELVENSLDANAKNIEINLTDNGLSLIEVRDDGCGISVTDAPNMAAPHCTSKMLHFTDLESLLTYGFRGEALNAICRVAEVTVTTKTIQDETAKLYTLDNDGNIIDSEFSHRFVGTTVRVKELFKNFPVRRQMITNLRKSKQEIKLVESLLKSLGICQPIVRITYRVNNNLVFLKPSCTDIKEALNHFVGSKVAANLEWIQDEDSEAILQLMIPKKDLADLNAVCESGEQHIIVNNRPVKYKQFEKVLIDRVSDRFGNKVPARKRPAYLISIKVPPSDIDVNLEPNKTSVLLKNQDTVLKKLDNILIEYYNLGTEFVRAEMSMLNTSIDGTPEYQDITQNIVGETEIRTCKKIKLNDKRRKSRELITDASTDSGKKRKEVSRKSSGNDLENRAMHLTETNRENKNEFDKISEVRTDTWNRDSVNKMLSAFSGPVLSDSDDESFANAENTTNLKETSLLVGHAVREETAGNDSESFMSSSSVQNAVAISERQDNILSESTTPTKPDNSHDALSQLPVVDLGEDFDIVAILEQSSTKVIKNEDIALPLENSNNENRSKTDSDKKDAERSYSALELWSRGQIPGLKGSTDVSVYNPKTSTKSSKDNEDKGKQNSSTIYHTGFSKFSYEIRAQVLEENPGITLPQIGQILASRWKELSPEERGYYRDLALEEKKNVDAENKKSRHKQLSQQEVDKNKARLIHMLESMKKSKTNKKCPLNERTTVPWEITVQSITKSFFSKSILEKEKIIGPLTDKIWALKSHGKIYVVNSGEVFKGLGPSESGVQETDAERTLYILQSWLAEKKTNSAIMHPIHTIGTLVD